MAKYIEREKAMQFLDKHMDEVNSVAPKASITSAVYDMAKRHAIDYLRYAPAADVAEVKHGKWETKPNTGGYEVCMKCSVCAFQFDNWQHIFSYCPVCGAKMDGDNNA